MPESLSQYHLWTPSSRKCFLATTRISTRSLSFVRLCHMSSCYWAEKRRVLSWNWNSVSLVGSWLSSKRNQKWIANWVEAGATLEGKENSKKSLLFIGNSKMQQVRKQPHDDETKSSSNPAFSLPLCRVEWRYNCSLPKTAVSSGKKTFVS